MNIKNLFQSFNKKTTRQASLSIVIFNDGIYLSKLNPGQKDSGFVSFYDLDNNAWDEVLNSALQENNCHNLDAKVTFGAFFYQSYQIDKPNIPKEEWPSALPFLLKDLTNENVANIIADGLEQPHSNKIKAYVIQKVCVDTLKTVLDAHHIKLEFILPEDEVWPNARPDLDAFMLLHRSHKSEFKISAYAEYASVFQRIIRGVPFPISGKAENSAKAENSLELDSLALEVQRSMDYLSSQLKQFQINKLLLCCDGEMQAELAQGLQLRLNVTVEPLFADKSQPCGEVVASKALALSQPKVNLYPQFLRPKKDPFSFSAVVGSWLLLAVTMCLVFGVYSFKNRGLDSQITELNHKSDNLMTQVKDLNTKLAEHKPSAAKLAAIDRLQEDIKAKQEALTAIAGFDTKKQAGYSGVMKGLAAINRDDISLNKIDITDDKMNIEGLARSPEVVPSWLQQFKDELNLVGRSFTNLSIGRNEDDIVIFSLQSKEEGK
ncbi:MAG: MSHA biogenesis protein MshI [Vibrio sp.]